MITLGAIVIVAMAVLAFLVRRGTFRRRAPTNNNRVIPSIVVEEHNDVDEEGERLLNRDFSGSRVSLELFDDLGRTSRANTPPVDDQSGRG
jgi:hypothetical protein